jgi:hypothetical protein
MRNRQKIPVPEAPNCGRPKEHAGTDHDIILMSGRIQKMPSNAARNIEYNGSIAYDLSRFDKRKRVRDALELEPIAVPRPIAKPSERVRTAAKAKARPVVSASTIVGFIMTAVLMFCVVLNYMRLNEITIQVSTLQTQLNDLEGQAAVLKVQTEKKLNIQSIEERAGEMGMRHPSSDQIVYIDMSQPDRGVVVSEQEKKTDFLNGIRTFFFAAIDFFK